MEPSAEPRESLLPVGELIQSAVRLYRLKAKQLALVALVGLIVLTPVMFAAAALGIGTAIAVGSIEFTWATVFFVAIVMLAFVFVSLAQTVPTLALIRAIGSGESKSVFQTYKETVPLILPFLTTVALVGLLTLGAYVLFIVPGVIFNIFFGLAVFVFVFEGKRGMEAILMSWAYVSGRSTEVFWRMAATAIYVLPFLVVSKGLEKMLHWMSQSYIGPVLINLLSVLVVTPLVLTHMYLVYKDVRRVAGEVSPRYDLQNKIVGVSAVGFVVGVIIFGTLGRWLLEGKIPLDSSLPFGVLPF